MALLCAGVEGTFDKGDVVEIRDGSGRVHGRGLVNYPADACRKLAGRRSVNYALLAAFSSNGKASVITPLAGLYPLVSIPIAIFLLGERIGWRETLGITLALFSAAALSCSLARLWSGASSAARLLSPTSD